MESPHYWGESNRNHRVHVPWSLHRRGSEIVVFEGWLRGTICFRVGRFENLLEGVEGREGTLLAEGGEFDAEEVQHVFR